MSEKHGYVVEFKQIKRMLEIY